MDDCFFSFALYIILDIDWSVYSWRTLFSMYVFLFFFVDEDRCTLVLSYTF